jgi:hypothetical protein
LDWIEWVNTQGLEGGNSVEIAGNALASGLPVYRVTTYLPEMDSDAYELEPYSEYFNKVVSVN